MPSLAELQRSLARGLAAPEGGGAGDIGRARRALVDKRSRAASRILPRSRAVLAGNWRQRFADHASRYVPTGLLYHVDDAWAFGLELAEADDETLRRAAHDDLVSLRVQWTRRPTAQALRIAERRSMVIAVQDRCLVVRLPGVDGRIWRVPLPGGSRTDR